MPQIYDMGATGLLAFRKKAPLKIRRLRSDLNPRTWVPEASTLTPRTPKPLLLRDLVNFYLTSRDDIQPLCTRNFFATVLTKTVKALQYPQFSRHYHICLVFCNTTRISADLKFVSQNNNIFRNLRPRTIHDKGCLLNFRTQHHAQSMPKAISYISEL
jgi:hypothetical protein